MIATNTLAYISATYYKVLYLRFTVQYRMYLYVYCRCYLKFSAFLLLYFVHVLTRLRLVQVLLVECHIYQNIR